MAFFYYLVYLLPYLVFFVIYFFYTQKIYYYNKVLPVFIGSLLLIVLTFLCSEKEKSTKTLAVSTVLFFYCLFLFLIKKNYNRVNNFFIKKQWVDNEYLNKDFTWITNSEFNYEAIWDKKIAAKPSWFDRALSVSLLLLPMLAAVGLEAIVDLLL